ncbi:hypothetical protein [Streptomyces malaysiensis]|uniref:Major facilitator superfamily transporter n=1 Tax=Streptomyces malaysiensis TaxID=92644 RepID=A0A7X5X751_STRMQ|nr:hypothetical protein [Streptomyces malaysiensis]NIY67105.1 major facilitator superfamily transporter [Streptomyces malaysiensis]
MTALVVGMLFESFAMPLFGALSDRIGRRPVYIGGAIAVIVWAYPFFAMFDSRGSGGSRGGIPVRLTGPSLPASRFLAEGPASRLLAEGSPRADGGLPSDGIGRSRRTLGG